MAVTCRHCGKPLYKGATGEFEHERRTDPTVTGGRRAAPGPLIPPKSGEPPKADSPAATPPSPEKIEETPPKREHILHKVVIGGKKKEDVA